MYDENERAVIAEQLAIAFLASGWTDDGLAEAAGAVLDRWPAWASVLAVATIGEFRERPITRRRRLTSHIDRFLAALPSPTDQSAVPKLVPRPAPGDVAPPVRRPDRQRRSRRHKHSWPIAKVSSVTDLAEVLELSTGQLRWLADVKSLERSVDDEQLRNYRYALVKRRGGIPRVIEAPKGRLKEVQRWILREILGRVPLHPAAHGFTADRSVLTNALPHVGQTVVLKLDLKDFFASVAARRVFGIFITLGYRPDLAHALTGLCTNSIPQIVWAAVPAASEPGLVQQRFWLGRQLATPHLPQGAPTSPALANLAAFGLDRRLSALAVAAGWRYSRYADDITFSGASGLGRGRVRLEALISEIVSEEGFVLNRGKSRLQTRASRQAVCGVVVNVRPNVMRPEYERLKATLHNAAKYGPDSQNHDAVPDYAAHLAGRVAWVNSLNPARGEKLRRQYAAIDWS